MTLINLIAEDLPSDPVETAEAAAEQLGNFLLIIMDGGIFPIVLVGVVAAGVVVGSAAFASSIAESRLRSRNLHFLIGMFIPVIYPALAFVALPRRKYHRKGDDDIYDLGAGKRSDGAPPPDGPALPPKQVADKGDSLSGSALPTSYDDIFFKGLLFDEGGNARGPFILTIDDVEVRIERILDAMPEVAVLETMNSDGKQQTLRIPYTRINGCREL